MAKPATDLAAGRGLYVADCARCHGDTGAGDGPDAARMIPRPRDLTTGVYKFRTTASGTAPTDDDLFQTITSGLAGTRMLGWEGLSEDARWQLVFYLKSLSSKFTEQPPQPAASFGKDPGPKGVHLAKGKQLYADLGCAACHGAMGRANGGSAKLLVDDWGQPTLPANLTHGWSYRGGADPKDIVARLVTGVDGTPMPSYADAVASEDLWQLAYYLHSVQERPRGWGWQVKAKRVAALPASPTDPSWDAAPRTDTRLWSNVYVNGEVVRTMVPWAMIQAVASADVMAIRLGWDDPTEDRGIPPDQLALVFKPEGVGWEVGSIQSWPEGQGQVVGPALNVLLWSAAAADQAREALADSFDLPDAAATDQAQAKYDEGRWWLTITRPLPPNVNMPFSLAIWDGGNGEMGRVRSVSTWLHVTLEQGESHGDP